MPQFSYSIVITWKEGDWVKAREEMNESLVYIEQHLEEELSVSIISKAMGYSEFHFSRMFKFFASMSVMEYVKKRRLLKASEEILKGKKSSM